MPTYRPRSTRVRAHVGPGAVGFFNLRASTPGKQGVGSSDKPQIVEAWRWKSVRTYTKASLAGGMKSLVGEIEGWVDHMSVQSAAVLHNALLPTFEKSRVLCPKDKGLPDPMSLVNSGRLLVEEKMKKGKGKTVASISYGAAGRPYYAVFVHEILTYHHEAPTRSKFLEAPLREDMAAIKQRLAEGMKPLIG